MLASAPSAPPPAARTLAKEAALPSRFDPRRKIAPLHRVRRACARARHRGERVVFTNGCFDLLHPGHVRALARARRLGDLLVVGLNRDRSVRRLKGPGRPIQDEAARAEVLAALESVDWVVLFEGDTPIELVHALEPDVLVKGADWGREEIVGAREVRDRGGRVVRIPLVGSHSTSAIVRRISRGAGRRSARRARE